MAMATLLAMLIETFLQARIAIVNTFLKASIMVDVSPEALNNPTLGAAVNLPFLDEIEAQDRENLSAKAEGRIPRQVVKRDRFPGAVSGTWRTPPSNDTGVDFAFTEPDNEEVEPHDSGIESGSVATGDEPDSGIESSDSSAG